MNQALFYFFNGFAGVSLVSDALIVFLADYAGFIALFFLVGYQCVLFLRHERATSRAFLGSIGIAGIAWAASYALKAVIASPRPFLALDGVRQLITHGGFDSFPSGHTTFFFAIGLSLFRHSRRWGSIFLGTAVLTGAARIAAGIHWPLDIVGGLLLAALTVLIAHRARRRYNHK